ncbi:MAG: NAD kinase [Bacteroidetes bacterium]|nr:NAD kinase [Bacteroidota bacterium]
MKIAVYGKTLKEDDITYIQQLFDILAEKKFEVVVYDDYFKLLRKSIKFSQEVKAFKNYDDVHNDTDYLFSLGGDGTILDALSIVRDSNIPIMGINIGRLGFLASIGKEDIKKAVEHVEKGTYVLDKRSLLRLESNKPLFGDVNYALNDFTIHKKDTSSMITIHTYINGDYLNTYWADGIIVSTPTGSSGYSLSCGGPIIFPNSNNFVITPVAPHNLNIRPIVVSNESVISFTIEGRNENFLCTLDSRFETIDSTFQLAVRKEEFEVSLIRLDDENFLTTLRNKMMWGFDKRN